MTNDSNKDVITTSDSNNILPAKLENVKWFKSNAWMIMPHFYIMVYFIEKTITLYIQLVVHCSKLVFLILNENVYAIENFAVSCINMYNLTSWFIRNWNISNLWSYMHQEKRIENFAYEGNKMISLLKFILLLYFYGWIDALFYIVLRLKFWTLFHLL